MSINHLRTLLFATLAVYSITKCHSFTPSSYYHLIHQPQASAIQRTYYPIRPRHLFREFISDEEEDLRADIAVIKKQEGLDDFLKVDDRLCVIKLYAPFCKACRAFGVKFRHLASVKGDRVNAAGEAKAGGQARFGEIEYSSNIKLCKNLGIKKFPYVLIYRGGERSEQLSGIVCKQKTAINDIVAAMDAMS